MDAEGVALQVVSPVPVTFCHDAPAGGAAVLASAQNDFLAELAAQRPDRFRALGAVPLQDPGLAVAELRRCVRQLGFPGVEIGTRAGHRELGDTCFDPFFDAAAARRSLVHPPHADPRLAVPGVAFQYTACETGIAARAC
jgi:aminocarboxymuconate-semialdehyde decarboxylase